MKIFATRCFVGNIISLLTPVILIYLLLPVDRLSIFLTLKFIGLIINPTAVGLNFIKRLTQIRNLLNVIIDKIDDKGIK